MEYDVSFKKGKIAIFIIFPLSGYDDFSAILKCFEDETKNYQKSASGLLWDYFVSFYHCKKSEVLIIRLRTFELVRTNTNGWDGVWHASWTFSTHKDAGIQFFFDTPYIFHNE